MQVVKRIAGENIVLEKGQWYLATRQMADRQVENYSINIITDFSEEPIVVIPNLTWDQANEFLAEFNNGKMSFDGRIW